MLHAGMTGDLVTLQELLRQDRALACCKCPVRLPNLADGPMQ